MNVLIEGATIIDGVNDAPMSDAAIEIVDGTVRAIGPCGSFAAAPGAKRVDLSGRWVMPGIINVHRHLYYGGGHEDAPADTHTGPIAQNARRLLAYGVTHALSLGLDGISMDAFLADQAAGRTTGARIMFAGFGSSAAGGWQTSQNLHRPTTAEEGREAVRAELPRNIHVVKFWLDDDHGRLPKLQPEIYEAIIDEGHKHGLKVFCHMFSQSDAKAVIRAGVDVLAHSIYDEEVDDELLALAKQHGVTLITTLVGHSQGVFYSEGKTDFLADPELKKIFPPDYITPEAGKDRAHVSVVRDTGGGRFNLPIVQRELDNAMKNAARMFNAGVRIALGTDGGNLFGLDDHREMELLALSGIPVPDVLRIATSAGAELLGIGDRYGSLQPGKAADFIVLAANPLADIRNTRSILDVWLDGEVVDRDALATPDLTKPS